MIGKNNYDTWWNRCQFRFIGMQDWWLTISSSSSPNSKHSSSNSSSATKQERIQLLLNAILHIVKRPHTNGYNRATLTAHWSDLKNRRREKWCNHVDILLRDVSKVIKSLFFLWYLLKHQINMNTMTITKIYSKLITFRVGSKKLLSCKRSEANETPL